MQFLSSSFFNSSFWETTFGRFDFDSLLTGLGHSSIWPILFAVVIFLVLTIFRQLIAKLIIKVIRRIRRENQTLWPQWQEKLQQPLARVIFTFALFTLIYTIFSQGRYGGILIQIASSLAVISLFVFLYNTVSLLVDDMSFMAKKHGHEPDLTAIYYITTALKVGVVILGILALLSNWVDNVSAIVASIGVGGLIIALAAQDTASNIFASIAILLDKPFSVGDWVSVDTAEGSVEKIGIRSTHIRRDDQTLVSLPNSKVANAVINNMTLRQTRMVSFSLDFDMNSTAAQMEALVEKIREILANTAGVLDEEQYVYFDRLELRLLKVMVRFTTSNDYEEMLRVREQINLKIIAYMESVGMR